MKSKLTLLFMMFVFLVQGQFINLDLNSEFELDIQSLSDEKGAKINLGNKINFPFLRLSSYDLKQDLEYPIISRSVEFPLVFGVEDQKFTEQFRIDLNGYLVSQKLSSNNKRNVVADKDGRLMLDTTHGYSGILNIGAFEFVSEWNPGDDHNYLPAHGIILHEDIGFSSVVFERLIAQIHLPHGSVIRKIVVYYRDNNADADQDLTCALTTSPNMSPTELNYSNVPIDTSSGAVSSIRTMMRDNLNTVLDNENNRYFIRAWNPHEESEWGGNEVGIASVVVYYD